MSPPWHAPPAATPGLRAYLRPVFDLGRVQEGVLLPLADEPFVACWAGWVEEGRRRGVHAVLATALPQLGFPVREGVSQTDAYRSATRQGRSLDELPEASGLDLERPAELDLELHPTPAGRIPVLVARHRPDFVRLVQALAHRNEPVPVPAAQGAAVVSGYVNWSRAREARERLGRLPTAAEKHL
ncbi:MAG TPA: hypothetical protein VHM02_14200 [Thermoanaerobaculia bacterium]|nr:hypothetical protein [Thermoanaerobaculia bacterium]